MNSIYVATLFFSIIWLLLVWLSFKIFPNNSIRPFNLLVACAFTIYILFQFNVEGSSTTAKIYEIYDSSTLYNLKVYGKSLIQWVGDFSEKIIDEHSQFYHLVCVVICNMLMILIYAAISLLVKALVLMLPKDFSIWASSILKEFFDNSGLKKIVWCGYYTQVLLVSLFIPLIAYICADPQFNGGEVIEKMMPSIGGVIWPISFILCAELYYSFANVNTFFGFPSYKIKSVSQFSMMRLYKTYENLAKEESFFKCGVVESKHVLSNSSQNYINENTRPLHRLINSLSDDVSEAEKNVLIKNLPNFVGMNSKSKLFFEGQASEIFYRIVSELLLSINDQGGISLIICPEDSQDFIESNIKSAIDPDLASLTLNWRSISLKMKKSINTRMTSGVLIGAETDLYNEFFKNELKGVGDSRVVISAIFVLDYHKLNLSQLRLELARINSVGYLQDTSFLCQTDIRNGNCDQLNDIFPFGSENFQNISLNTMKNKKYRLVWSESKDLFRFLLGKFSETTPKQTILSSMPLLRIPAWEVEGNEGDFKTAQFDPDYQDGQFSLKKYEEWINIFQTSKKGLSQFLGQLSSYTSFLHLDFRAPVPDVIFVEDFSNLAYALNQEITSSGSNKDLMFCYLSLNYPLRGYFFDKFKASWKSVNTIKEGDRECSPLSVIPRADIGQLARVVYDRLRAKGGASQNDIAKILYSETLTPREVVTSLNITASRDGLQNLFMNAFDKRKEDIDIIRKVDDSHTLHFLIGDGFKLPNSDGLHGGSFSHCFFEVKNNGEYLTIMQQGDVGLLFSKGDSIQFKGEYYAVKNINYSGNHIESIDVQVESQSSPTILRPNILFSRSYQLIDGSFVEEDSMDFARGNRVDSLGQMSISRISDMKCSIETGGEPCRDNRPSWFKLGDAGIVENRRHCTVWSMKIESEIDENLLSKVAFTLCVTLQDTLQSWFPLNYKRLAVVSAQATEFSTKILELEGGKELPSHEEFLLASQPRLKLNNVKSDDTGVFSNPSNQIQIYVIEDSAFDLGCARSLYKNNKALWLNYLRWLVSNDVESRQYHSFGSDGNQLKLLDFSAALKVLEHSGVSDNA